MKSKSTKLWLVALTGLVLVIVVVGVFLRSMVMTPVELRVDELFKSSLSSPSSRQNWSEGMSELVALGPEAIPPMVKRARGRGNSLEVLYKQLRPKIPLSVRKHLPMPVDYEANRVAVMTAIAEHGPFAARHAVAEICENLEDPDFSVSMSARDALNWVIPESAYAKAKLLEQFAATNRFAFGRGGQAQLWELMPELVPEITANLPHRDWGYHAAIVLGKIGTNAVDAVPELVKALDAKLPEYAGPTLHNTSPNHDGRSHHRAMAARALGEIGDAAPEVVQVLTDAWNDPVYWVRENAAGAVLELGPAFLPELPALLSGLEDTNNRVLYLKLQAIGGLGAEARDALPVLDRLSDTNVLAALVADPESRVGGQSLDHLSLTARIAAAKIDEDRTSELIPDLLNSWENYWGAVAFMTNATGYASEIIAACETVLDEPGRNPHMKAEFVILCLDPKHERARASLNEVLRTGEIDDRFRAARWLVTAGVGIDGLDSVILKGLNGPDSGVRQRTIHLLTLLKTNGMDVGDWVEQACWNSDQFARQQAGILLRKFYPERLPPLVEPGK